MTEQPPQGRCALPDPALVVLVGAAGAGKSTWARANYADRQVLCLDELRALVCDDESDQDATSDAVAVMDLVAAARLSRRCTTVVDATNTSVPARRVLLGLAAQHGVPAAAVVFCTPLAVCLARNDRRPATPAPGRRWARRVPARVVREQHAAAMAARPVLRREGFTHVHLVAWEGELR